MQIEDLGVDDFDALCKISAKWVNNMILNQFAKDFAREAGRRRIDGQPPSQATTIVIDDNAVEKHLVSALRALGSCQALLGKKGFLQGCLFIGEVTVEICQAIRDAAPAGENLLQ